MDGPDGGWRVLVPETRRERMRGLRGQPPPGPREAMLFRSCRSVHTFGMGRVIRVALLDDGMRVIAVADRRPRRVVLPRPGVRHVLEAAPGCGILAGDRFRSAARRPR
jgi:uncharacterized protein